MSPLLVTAIFAASLLTVAFHLALVIGAARRGTPRPRWNVVARMGYGILVVAAGVAAASALPPTLGGEGPRGWWLFTHIHAAAPFLAGLAVVAVTLAAASGFGRSERSGEAFGGLAKGVFWALLVSGLVTAVPMLVAMLPVASTAELEELIELHRWAGVVFVAILPLHVYLVILGRLGRA